MDKKIRIIFILICVILTNLSFSQDKVELLNKGNKYFEEGDFEKAEKEYKKSLDIDNKYYKANLNIGHSLFNQAISLMKDRDSLDQKQDADKLKKCDSLITKKCSDSESYYKNSVELAKNKNEQSESLYNLGNVQLLSQQLAESIESYKKSLRLVPENKDAKHNLALAQYLLNKQQKNQQNNKDSKEDKKENQDKKEDKKENKNKEDKNLLRKEDINQILNALEEKEKEVQEDLQKKKEKGSGGSGKVIKDW